MNAWQRLLSWLPVVLGGLAAIAFSALVTTAVVMLWRHFHR